MVKYLQVAKLCSLIPRRAKCDDTSPRTLHIGQYLSGGALRCDSNAYRIGAASLEILVFMRKFEFWYLACE